MFLYAISALDRDAAMGSNNAQEEVPYRCVCMCLLRAFVLGDIA
jgi:hypothetical protein